MSQPSKSPLGRSGLATLRDGTTVPYRIDGPAGAPKLPGAKTAGARTSAACPPTRARAGPPDSP